jgi:F1F0 ATPase subunit 2
MLGIVFFGGLYLTIQKLNEVRYPSLLIILSSIFRMVVLLGGLFYVSQKGYIGIFPAVLGIILLRGVMIFIINKQIKKSENEVIR